MTGHHFAIFDTSIGRCGIVWGARGINSRATADGRARTRPAPGLAAAPWRARRGAAAGRRCSAAIDGIVELLEGKPNDLADVVLDLDGVPEFNRGVYDIARSIPPGKTLDLWRYRQKARRRRAVARRRPGARAQSLSDRGALPPRARRRRQARRILQPMAAW